MFQRNNAQKFTSAMIKLVILKAYNHILKYCSIKAGTTNSLKTLNFAINKQLLFLENIKLRN